MSYSDHINEIISDLNELEKRIMLILGKENISLNKNIRLETIKKKLKDHELRKADKAIDNLIAKGLIFRYRGKKNIGLSHPGLLVAKKIKQNHRDSLYDGLRILIEFQ